MQNLRPANTVVSGALSAMLGLSVLAGCKSPPPREEAPAPVLVAEAAPAVDAAAVDAEVEGQATAQPRGAYNVVLILIDSLRADMPWTGYPRPIAPRLSQFAEQWTLYPRAYSLSSYTAKSVAPLLAGLYPGEMSRSDRFFTHWPADNDLLSEMAQRAGHRTMAGMGHGYFLPHVSGINQGFDDYRLLPGTALDGNVDHAQNSDRMTKQAIEMLSKPENVDQAAGKRFFAYFHYLDPHFTYRKNPNHPDFGNQPRDRYDNEVHFADHWVGELIDFIDAQPFGKDTAIVISADHGEGFGERGRNRHAYDVWESLIRVPLLVRVPNAAPRRIEEPRSAIDLAPTILDLMGITPSPAGDAAAPTALRGQSLVAEILGAEPTARPVYAEVPRADLMDRRRAFIDGKYKIIAFGDNAKLELFDVTVDPREENDLAKKEPEVFEAMKKKYLEFIAEIPNKPVVGTGPLLGAPPGQRY